MDCPHCGTLVQEDQEICPACGGQVHKRSFWQRLLQFLSPGLVTRTKTIRTTKVVLKNITSIDKETGKLVTLEEIPPELRAKLTDALPSGQGQLLTLEEIPSEVRAKIAEAIASGQGHVLLEGISPELRDKLKDAIASGHGVTKKVFTFQDPDGEKRTYHSLDEMPPDIRAQFKQAVASTPAVTEEFFSYESQDGQKHTYHSLDEMPPEIRAVFRDCLPPEMREHGQK